MEFLRTCLELSKKPPIWCTCWVPSTIRRKAFSLSGMFTFKAMKRLCYVPLLYLSRNQSFIFKVSFYSCWFGWNQMPSRSNCLACQFIENTFITRKWAGMYKKSAINGKSTSLKQISIHWIFLLPRSNKWPEIVATRFCDSVLLFSKSYETLMCYETDKPISAAVFSSIKPQQQNAKNTRWNELLWV